jgi:hypothetical protein
MSNLQSPTQHSYTTVPVDLMDYPTPAVGFWQNIQGSESETWNLTLDYWNGDTSEITVVLFDELVTK